MLKTAIPALSLLLLVPAASAQDSDADGVADASDILPCDPSVASIAYAPGQGSWSMQTFEDQWPEHTDLDYNDVVVRTHLRLYGNGVGQITRVSLFVQPVALGGIYDNGLALQLPASRTGVTARRRIAGGAWQSLALEADATATVVISPNLRELFGGSPGVINSESGVPAQTGQMIELELSFATPAAIDGSLAPFDLFAFRAGDFAHQIHFPQYGGTAAMDGALFNTGTDASSPSRRFVHFTGTPFALHLESASLYPLEGVAIDQLFPDIVGFAQSGGVTNSNFYASTVASSQGFPAGGTPVPTEPTADTSCVQQSGGALTPGNTTAIATRNGFQVQCRQWNGNECTQMYISVPQSAFTEEASCGVPDKTSLRPMWHGSVQLQCQTVCWVATGNATCVASRGGASSGSGYGWMYTSSGSPRCDASGRQYSTISVPTVGSQLWSFDNMSWQRNGSFSGYTCNW